MCNITFLGYDMTKEPCLNGPMVNGTSENMWQFRYMNQSEVRLIWLVQCYDS